MHSHKYPQNLDNSSICLIPNPSYFLKSIHHLLHVYVHKEYTFT